MVNVLVGHQRGRSCHGSGFEQHECLLGNDVPCPALAWLLSNTPECLLAGALGLGLCHFVGVHLWPESARVAGR